MLLRNLSRILGGAQVDPLKPAQGAAEVIPSRTFGGLHRGRFYAL